MNVSLISPEKKDYDRAKNLAVNNNYNTIASEASKMSKLIKDLDKLVRRSKAVAEVWSDLQGGVYFDIAFTPFEEALKRVGFTDSDIDIIKGENNIKKSRKQVATKSEDNIYTNIKW